MTAPVVTEQSSAGGIEQWDLTGTVSSYLDRHMVFPLLEYIDKLIEENTVSYESNGIAEARLALLRPTHMVDYAIDIYKSIHADDAIPNEMQEQKEAVMKQLDELSSQCAPLDKIASDAEQLVR
jgi:translation initiation factor 3 subunit E